MNEGHDKGRLDWLVEIVGAVVPAAATAFAAASFAPHLGWSTSTAVLIGFGGMFAAAFAAMRSIPAEAHQLGLPEFVPGTIDGTMEPDILLLDTLMIDRQHEPMDELLLDQPLIEGQVEAVAELLLDDPLPAPDPGSRVVQLFAADRMPTAAELKQRIDRHLADGQRPSREKAEDASDVLSEALAELRRSLRQA